MLSMIALFAYIFSDNYRGKYQQFFAVALFVGSCCAAVLVGLVVLRGGFTIKAKGSSLVWFWCVWGITGTALGFLIHLSVKFYKAVFGFDIDLTKVKDLKEDLSHTHDVLRKYRESVSDLKDSSFMKPKKHHHHHENDVIEIPDSKNKVVSSSDEVIIRNQDYLSRELGTTSLKNHFLHRKNEQVPSQRSLNRAEGKESAQPGYSITKMPTISEVGERSKSLASSFDQIVGKNFMKIDSDLLKDSEGKQGVYDDLEGER